jgi:hypothetical protein
MRALLFPSLLATLVCATPAYAEMRMDAPVTKGAIDTPPPLEERVSKLPVARDGEVIDSLGSGAIEPALSIERTVGNIRYITGGVGDEELAVIKAKEGEYNLRVLVSGTDGEYMGNLTVELRDSADAVLLTARQSGPYFYASVPAGKYTLVITSMRGVSKNVVINAPATPGKGRTNVRF